MIRALVTPIKSKLPLQFGYSLRALTVNVEKDPAVVFEEISEKNKANKPLALRDLRHILVNAKDVKQTKFVIGGVKLYQTKGFDFSEELCSLFVKFLVQTNQVQAAAQTIVKPSYRIGSWLTKKSLDQLSTALLENNKLELAVAVLKTTSDRGLKIASDETISAVVKATAAAGAEEKYNEVLAVVTAVSDADKAAAVAAQFPLVAATTEAASS